MNNEYTVKSILDYPVDEIPYIADSLGSLKAAGINTIGDLLASPAEDLVEDGILSWEIVQHVNYFLSRWDIQIKRDHSLPFLALPIEDLELSMIPYKGLKRAGIDTISDLLEHSPEQLLEIKTFKQKHVDEIVESLARSDIELPEYGTPVTQYLKTPNQ